MTETPPLVQKSDKLLLWKTDTSEYLDIENAPSVNLLWRKWNGDFSRGQPLEWKKTKHSGFRFMFQESISGKYLKSDVNIANPILAGTIFNIIHEIPMKPPYT